MHCDLGASGLRYGRVMRDVILDQSASALVPTCSLYVVVDRGKQRSYPASVRDPVRGRCVRWHTTAACARPHRRRSRHALDSLEMASVYMAFGLRRRKRRL